MSVFRRALASGIVAATGAAVAAHGASSAVAAPVSTVAATVAASSPSLAGGTTARINTRWSSVADAAGRVWAGRRGFTGPMGFSQGLAGRDVLGTTDDVLYRSNVFGATGFAMPVANGPYRVRLLMAEDYHTKPGRRVFDVHAEGQPALTDVDIARAVGRHHAYDRSFDVVVRDGRLDLALRAKADKTLVSAIEILPVATTTPSGLDTTAKTTDSTVTTSPTGSTTVSSSLLSLTSDVKGGGRKPVISGDSVTSSAGAGDSRSEVFWGTEATGRLALDKGTTVTTEFQVRHFLNDPRTGAAPSPKTWHTFFQLHGPTHRNTWPGPPVTIAWQNGTYRVGGGASVPDSSGKLVNRGSWHQPYLAAPNGVWRTFKVQTYLDGPGKGWLSVWVDGQPYITRWKPTAGTMYTTSGPYSHREINVKTGLYTGTESPSWNRSVEHRGMRVEYTTGNVSATAAMR